MMGRKGIKRLVIKDADCELQLEREDTIAPGGISRATQEEDVKHPKKVRHHDIPASLNTPVEHHEPKEVEGRHITSPMVGTFYGSPSPDDPSFVKVGDTVTEDTVVCIVEAMKVMNEVKAGLSGTVTEVLVESGHPVEFGSKLFRIS